jgi:hypothetical protein
MHQERKKEDLLGLKIGTGLLIGCFLISIGLYIVGPDKVISFFESFDAAEKKAQQEAQDKIEFYRVQAKRNEALVEQERMQQQEKERREMEMKQLQQRALLSKMNENNQETKDKQAKWQRFFKENPLCANPKNWKQQVECADERMKAEEQFEALYRAGKI